MNAFAESLESLPTLHQGHDSDLKIETDSRRTWLVRCWRDYPEVDPVYIEELIDGRWCKVEE